MQFGSSLKRRRKWKGALSAALLICVAAIFLILLSSFGQTTLERQQESLTDAIHRDIVQCYALEGVYPPSLEYLQEHYGLTWDPETFFVDYEPIGSNLYPDVTVMIRGK